MVFYIQSGSTFIYDCKFESIATRNSLIYSQNGVQWKSINVTNAEMIHITNGFVFKSDHIYYVYNIHIDNMTITSNQFASNDTNERLFYLNRRCMIMENINIRQTICYLFITNQFVLSINNLWINPSNEHNPNNLWIESSLFISGTHFIGSQFQVWLITGSAKIKRCIL